MTVMSTFNKTSTMNAKVKELLKSVYIFAKLLS